MIAKQPFLGYIASFALFACLSTASLYPHGFHKDTIIYCDVGNTIQTLEQITERVKKNKRKYVTSYDQQAHQYVEKRVRAAGFSQVPYYCALSFNDEPITDIICSPTQHFYRLSDQKWVAAQELMIGDVLLAKRNGSVRVTALAIVQQTLPVYTIHVKDTYTFLVGAHSVVAHNVILPMAATIGFGIPFSTGCSSGIGAVFGPVGFIGGILLGVGCGFLVNTCFKERYVEYGIALETPHASSYILNNDKGAKEEKPKDKNSEAQVPGKPTENDGFIPKKNWDGKKARNPNGPGYGWPDKKGWVWIPTGPKGHGCPHWDVEGPDGEYENIVPGGRVRGQK